MMVRASPWLLVLVLLAGCQGAANEEITASEASDIANAQMAEDLPQVPLDMLKVETQDMGERWRVAYDTPGGSTGGPIIIDVDKDSGEVIFVAGGQ